ncbi:holin family protein [Bacillus atrophaeus]|uniref:phage holin family protein n=1 Tax=Bacillus atrophaeus TaxID=1452 RepID=UPI003873C307
MKHNTDTLWVAIAGGSVSTAAYLFGGIDNLFIAFGILIILDYITGLSVAYTTKTVSSKTGFKGAVKKGAMFSLVIAATQLDSVLGNASPFIRYAMLMYLIGIEGISLIENLGRLGIPVPKFLSDRFIQLKNDNESLEKEKPAE